MNETRERRRSSDQPPYTDVQVELTKMVFEGLLPTILIGGLGIVGATSILGWHYHDRFLGWLSACMLIACAGRAVYTARFLVRSRSGLSLQDANRWELGYGFLTILYAALLAASTFYNFAYHDYVARVWCLLGTSVVCAAFSSGLSLRPWLALAPGFILLLALSLSLLRSDDALVRWTVVLVAFYALQYRQSVKTKFKIIVDQTRTKRQLRNLSEHDALTGLANRRQFETALRDICTVGGRCALLYLDLDHFKTVNDTHGHGIGDGLLQAVAERLRTMVRESDLVARLGGDEFAVLQADPTSAADARALASRINRGLAEPFEVEGRSLRIGASVGIRLKTAEDTSPSGLLSDADKALYEVKRGGRGGFASADTQAMSLG